MAEMKRRTLVFSSGRTMKLFGNSVAISCSMQIGEGYAANIYNCRQEEPEPPKKGTDTNTASVDNAQQKATGAGKKREWKVDNPFGLTKDDFLELADYQIRLWMDLKDNLRKNDLYDHRNFNRDALL